MPLSPHQVSLQSRLLGEAFSWLLLGVFVSFKDESELTFEPHDWLAEAFPFSHEVRRGSREVVALLGGSGPGLACTEVWDRPSTAPGGFQWSVGRQPKRLWPPEEGVSGRDGIFAFGVDFGSGLLVRL